MCACILAQGTRCVLLQRQLPQSASLHFRRIFGRGRRFGWRCCLGFKKDLITPIIVVAHVHLRVNIYE